MNHSLNRIPAASVFAACLALTSIHSMAAVKVCTFPGSPSAALDETVARDAFAQAGIAATIVRHGIGEGDDDGVSLGELDKTLAQLPPRVRATFLLHRCDGMTLEEIGERFGVSRAQAKKYLARALMQIRKTLAE